MIESVDGADIAGWASDLREWIDSLGFLFNRPEPRVTFGEFVKGLLSDAPRKNAWGLADHAGHASPDRFQHLMTDAKWDADVLRDQVRSRVVEGLGDPGAVGVLDDTQQQKKGTKSVGVDYQYCGVTGDVRNVQTMVMLTYASIHGHAYIDRELYLPTSWTDEPERLKVAKVPGARKFATKPQLAAQMVIRATEAGVEVAAYVGDSGYGKDLGLRTVISSRSISYVFAVQKNQPLIDDAAVPATAEKIHRVLPRSAWQRRSQGDGEKGQRTYDFAMLPVAVPDEPAADGFAHTLLIRKSKQKVVKNGVSDYEYAYFLVHAPTRTSLAQMIRWTGLRWKIEEDNKTGKNEFGLADTQVRTWPAWHRHITSSMLVHAFVAVKRAELGKSREPDERTLIA
jgi:SRSO17 transposase